VKAQHWKQNGARTPEQRAIRQADFLRVFLMQTQGPARSHQVLTAVVTEDKLSPRQASA
jgi:hypothetical protein